VRILYFPQVSMRSHVDSRWLLRHDGCLVRMRAVVETLPREWRWTWALPDANVERHWPDALPQDVAVAPLPWMDNVRQGRAFFPMREVQALLREQDFDLVMTDVPEHVHAWREAGYDGPLIATATHLLPVDDKAGYLRQAAGALLADAVCFPTDEIERIWSSRSVFHVPNFKRKVWKGVFSPSEVEAAMTRTRKWPPDVPKVNFISRLSDNGRTHHEEFFEACRQLAHVGQKFEVWVQNPNEAMDDRDVARQCTRISRVGNSGRADYLRTLWQSDIVPILYDDDRILSIGLMESVAARCVVATPTHRSGLPGVHINYPDKVGELYDALDFSLQLVRDPKWREQHLDAQYEWLMDERSVERNGDRIRDIMEGAVK